jgi:hypothetical protein
LIQLILNPDPYERYTIEEIRGHPWFNQIEHQKPYSPSVIIGQDVIPVDEKILKTLEEDYLMDPT